MLNDSHHYTSLRAEIIFVDGGRSFTVKSFLTADVDEVLSMKESPFYIKETLMTGIEESNGYV